VEIMAKTYSEAVKEAIDALEDLEERGDAAIGGTWDELEKEIFTPEEIAASDLRVALIGEFVKARNEKGITQRKLEELSGVRQPIIARIEKGHISPQIETIMKLLAPLGKKLAIVPR
jgi:DNA-binding XRE family transcriptional regulator